MFDEVTWKCEILHYTVGDAFTEHGCQKYLATPSVLNYRNGFISNWGRIQLEYPNPIPGIDPLIIAQVVFMKNGNVLS